MKRAHIPARPTVYKGIQMRSRLEADYASALDRDDVPWKYEPTCFGGDSGQWLPDFALYEGPATIYVELKPAYLIEWDTPELEGVYSRADEILKRMSVAFESEPEAYLSLVFWSYGLEQVQAPLAIMSSRGGAPWITYTPSTVDVPLLWPGMGQYDELVYLRHKQETKRSEPKAAS